MIELPMRPEYGGCKSWIELDVDVPTDNATPVLINTAFEIHLRHFRTALDGAVAPVLLAANATNA
jgi:hypothetical protein